MGHTHVWDPSAVPCDDPEDQIVLAIGREGLLFTGDTSSNRVRSNWCVCPYNSKQRRCSWASGRIIRLEAWVEELFVISRVHHSILFSFNWINTTVELTITVSSHFKLFLLLRVTVSFPTDEWLSPEGRWFSRNSGYQDGTVPTPIRACGVCFCCSSQAFDGF